MRGVLGVLWEACPHEYIVCGELKDAQRVSAKIFLNEKKSGKYEIGESPLP